MPETKDTAPSDATKTLTTKQIDDAIEEVKAAADDGLEGAALVGVGKDGLPPGAVGLGVDEDTKPGNGDEKKEEKPVSSLRVFCGQHGMNPKQLLPYVEGVTDIDEPVDLEQLEAAHAASKERI